MISSLLLASLLLASPAGVDSRLADAAMKRDTAAIRTLVQQKVDVNAPGKDGTPALHWMVRVDDLQTAELLIRAGADVKLADRYGVTPLYLACANGNAAMIKLLLDNGADANTTDPTGETALMAASRVGNLESVKALLDRGAKVDAADPTYQQTSLMIAVREDHARRRPPSHRTRSQCECADADWANAGLDSSEFGGGLRFRQRNYSRRLARRSRLAILHSRWIDSALVCSARWKTRAGKDSGRLGRQVGATRSERHYAPAHGDQQQSCGHCAFSDR